jgi:hypothetical protein
MTRKRSADQEKQDRPAASQNGVNAPPQPTRIAFKVNIGPRNNNANNPPPISTQGQHQAQASASVQPPTPAAAAPKGGQTLFHDPPVVTISDTQRRLIDTALLHGIPMFNAEGVPRLIAAVRRYANECLHDQTKADTLEALLMGNATSEQSDSFGEILQTWRREMRAQEEAAARRSARSQKKSKTSFVKAKPAAPLTVHERLAKFVAAPKSNGTPSSTVSRQAEEISSVSKSTTPNAIDELPPGRRTASSAAATETRKSLRRGSSVAVINGTAVEPPLPSPVAPEEINGVTTRSRRTRLSAATQVEDSIPKPLPTPPAVNGRETRSSKRRQSSSSSLSSLNEKIIEEGLAPTAVKKKPLKRKFKDLVAALADDEESQDRRKRFATELEMRKESFKTLENQVSAVRENPDRDPFQSIPSTEPIRGKKATAGKDIFLKINMSSTRRNSSVGATPSHQHSTRRRTRQQALEEETPLLSPTTDGPAASGPRTRAIKSAQPQEPPTKKQRVGARTKIS